MLRVLALSAVACLTLAPERVRADAAEVARDVHSKGPYPDDLRVAPPGDRAIEIPGGIPVFGHREDRPRERPVSIDTRWLEDLAKWLDRHLGSLGIGKSLAYALFALVLLLLSAALAYLLARVRFRRGEPNEHAAEGEVAAATRPADPLLALPELSAEELRRLGRFREAVHALFVSSLLAVGYRPTGRARSRTAREIVMAVSDTDSRKSSLASLLSLTEIVWFGGREASEETYAHALTLHESIRGGTP